MAETEIVFKCKVCESFSVKWFGQCPNCKEWNTLVEEYKSNINVSPSTLNRNNLFTLQSVDNSKNLRLVTGISEFDKLLGGGICVNSINLLTGDPGIGKSTLLLQIAGALANLSKKIIYASGEENAYQIKIRSERILLSKKSLKNIKILESGNLSDILHHVESEKPDLVIIDSIQTLNYSSDNLQSSTSQLNLISSIIHNEFRKINTTFFFSAHVTKGGELAGPKLLEHLVDCVIYLRGNNETDRRFLNSTKNRFGSTNETSMFVMKSNGFEQVKDPSALLLKDRNANIAGSCVTALVEGINPLAVEIQSLVSKSYSNYPKRISNGIDLNRANLISAVIDKQTKIKLFNQDIYINVVGGIKLNGNAYDLPLPISIFSSFLDSPIPSRIASIGEVGLGGELRTINGIEKMIKELDRIGFEKFLIPKNSNIKGSNILSFDNINQILKYLFNRD